MVHQPQRQNQILDVPWVYRPRGRRELQSEGNRYLAMAASTSVPLRHSIGTTL